MEKAIKITQSRKQIVSAVELSEDDRTGDYRCPVCGAIAFLCICHDKKIISDPIFTKKDVILQRGAGCSPTPTNTSSD